MQEVIFDVETITPLFLAGADQKKVEVPSKYAKGKQLLGEERYTWQLQAEIRPPAFRGLMRYWQRALVGGIVGTDKLGLNEISSVEQTIFGATNRGSDVRIQIADIVGEAQEYKKEGNSRDNMTGKDYLLWSMAKSGDIEKKNLKIDRWYFPTGTRFKIVLSSLSQDSTSLDQAIATFWLLTNLGGIGSRSRRCAGSLIATPQQPLKGIAANFPFRESANMAELHSSLEKGIRAAKSLYTNLTQRIIQEADFDILSSNTSKIWIIQSNSAWHTSDEVMRGIGDSLQAYRAHFDEARAYKLLGKNIPKDHRGFNKLKALEIFGLPLGKNNGRRASPLLLRVTKLQGEFVGIAVLFKSKIDGIPVEYYSIIEDWLSTFSRKVQINL